MVNGVIHTPFFKKRQQYKRQQLEQLHIDEYNMDSDKIFDREEQRLLFEVSSNQTFWFDQQQDHFDQTNNITWKQQYQVIDDWFDPSQPNAPVFIFLAGEAPMGFFNFQEVQIRAWAQEFKALYVILEHRFYGQSYPTNDLSTHNLKYLTSQQALADAANFLTTFKSERGIADNQAVVFGCSYSGALSAWFRLKYPQLVVGSVAPSGPVLAQLNYTGYYAQFTNSAPTSCVNAAQQASDQVMQLIKQGDKGIKQLEKTFNSCSSLKNGRDLYYFVYSIVEALGGADQMNNPPTWTLNSTCNTLSQNSDLLVNWAEIFNQGLDDKCNDFTLRSFIDQARKTRINDQDGTRSWVFQTCAEFGYFSTTYPGSSVFPGLLNVEEQVKWCQEIYDVPGMTPNIDWTNSYYGGQEIKGSNIMFSNGLLDPWHLLSVNQDNIDGTVKAVTYEAGHCGTLIASTTIDPPSLVDARQGIIGFLKEILSA
ncbi:hypothetical protein DFA_07589 [Cavenderia fasciculata]|uniref:Peptidase S28 family protein n=1 Tax=Cavenderia fasciculata TaxID=261658 RepID=F4Q625_CACFS|nr:uncharacterized protein DFA_07589 [Cavenderia fasciculata]EGG16611.1 hypothetical protein DFA_07589 [Cavenderia fasciculata]|eukprot:XP_004355085.1 hypothetical protein DFA_07589 [Cavenderia fasciculata]